MTASNDTPPGRRRFLKGVIAAGGTGVLVAAGHKGALETEPQALLPEPAQPPESRQGYRLTAHIESYYAKARS